jgi:hypothetical protein
VCQDTSCYSQLVQLVVHLSACVRPQSAAHHCVYCFSESVHDERSENEEEMVVGRILQRVEVYHLQRPLGAIEAGCCWTSEQEQKGFIRL